MFSSRLMTSRSMTTSRGRGALADAGKADRGLDCVPEAVRIPALAQVTSGLEARCAPGHPPR